jgi:hypothetical protein
MTEQTIVEAALPKASPSERAAFLDKACAGDATLRRRVEERLRDRSADSALNERRVPHATPATGLADSGRRHQRRA